MIFLLLFSVISHAQLQGPHCNIKSIKRSVDNSSSQTIGLDIHGKPILKASSSSGHSEEVGLLIMAPGRSATIETSSTQSIPAPQLPTAQGQPVVIQFQQVTLKNEVKVTCKSITFSGMNLDIELTSANGSPLNSERSAVSTSVFLSKGQSVNLGGIVKDLNSKNKSADISQGVSMGETNGEKQYEYWLEAN